MQNELNIKNQEIAKLKEELKKEQEKNNKKIPAKVVPVNKSVRKY